MTALNDNRQTPLQDDKIVVTPVYAGVHIFRGAAVGVDSNGFLRPMVSGVALKSRGVATQEVDATNAMSGDLTCESRAGVHLFFVLPGDPVSNADLQNVCYFQDDQTIAKTSNSSARNAAGTLLQLVSYGGTTMAAVATGGTY